MRLCCVTLSNAFQVIDDNRRCGGFMHWNHPDPTKKIGQSPSELQSPYRRLNFICIPTRATVLISIPAPCNPFRFQKTLLLRSSFNGLGDSGRQRRFTDRFLWRIQSMQTRCTTLVSFPIKWVVQTSPPS